MMVECTIGGEKVIDDWSFKRVIEELSEVCNRGLPIRSLFEHVICDEGGYVPIKVPDPTVLIR